jgi:virginiamycin B lyase
MAMLKFLSVPILAVAMGSLLALDFTTAVKPVDMQEWQVPWENTRPRDPYVAPDGDIWFVGQRGDYVSEFDPQSEEFRRLELPDGAGPHNLIVDDKGFIWYAGNRAAHIGRLDPNDGSIQKFPMPDERARDPHTLVFDQNGDIWFSVQGGNFVGKLTVETGQVDLIEVPTQRARPYGILIDQNNRPWIALFGTNKLATVDPETMELTEIPLQREEARPRRIALTSDGSIWYVDYAQGYLGRYNPDDESFKEWKLPEGDGARPYAMASDNKDRLWLVETGVDPNLFVGFDPETEEFFSSTPIESGGGTVRHMVFHEPTNTIWFGTDTNYLGRAKLN